MEFMTKEREIGYASQLKLLYNYLTNIRSKNYPIKQNAQFIIEILKMQEGIQKILYPITPTDIPKNGFVVIDKDHFAFNYVAENREDSTMINTTFVLLQPSRLNYYILTQHLSALQNQSYYDFKYFGLKDKKVLIFDRIEDNGFFDDIFTLDKGVETAIQKIKTLSA